MRPAKCIKFCVFIWVGITKVIDFNTNDSGVERHDHHDLKYKSDPGRPYLCKGVIDSSRYSLCTPFDATISALWYTSQSRRLCIIGSVKGLVWTTVGWRVKLESLFVCCFCHFQLGLLDLWDRLITSSESHSYNHGVALCWATVCFVFIRNLYSVLVRNLPSPNLQRWMKRETRYDTLGVYLSEPETRDNLPFRFVKWYAVQSGTFIPPGWR